MLGTRNCQKRTAFFRTIAAKLCGSRGRAGDKPESHTPRGWRRKTGAIVNVGSYACYQTFPGIVAYAAAKGALAQITRTFALEAIEHGVRVNAAGSGDVVTNLLNLPGRRPRVPG